MTKIPRFIHCQKTLSLKMKINGNKSRNMEAKEAERLPTWPTARNLNFKEQVSKWTDFSPPPFTECDSGNVLFLQGQGFRSASFLWAGELGREWEGAGQESLRLNISETAFQKSSAFPMISKVVTDYTVGSRPWARLLGKVSEISMNCWHLDPPSGVSRRGLLNRY